ncbi:MAG: AmpG family muropeptide MFS transporter [Gammaproteobacteria bacterium]|nr:AmpG family muropeptide MFS transporter [Gammaproteobacteria bacterium]
MLFLGFSAGIPILLIFSSLGLWLREAGIERATVTYFSWAALGYSFKFVWAPLVDQLPLPWLSQVMGRRRAWMLVAQGMIILAILCMAMVDPQMGQSQLTLMALSAVLLGFSSATQDIVIDAYRIESAHADLQALMSAAYIAGYRIAMLVAGAGSLYLASWFGSTAEAYLYHAWQMTYAVMALTMIVGVVTTLVIDEPTATAERRYQYSNHQYLRFLALFAFSVAVFIGCFYISAEIVATYKKTMAELFANKHLASLVVESIRLGVATLLTWFIASTLVRAGLVDKEMLSQTYIMPVRDFFQRYGLSMAWTLLALIGLYRISDIVLGVISNVFYYDLGYSKTEIANAVKVFGVIMTIVGGFIGGLLSMRYGVIRILFVGGILASVTNLLFMLLASIGYDLTWLYIVVSADNLAAGIASAAFVAFLSSLTNISFTAMQYAIFSSLMTLIPKVLGGYSGSMVDSIGYSNFFLITTLLGIPVLILIAVSARRLE